MTTFTPIPVGPLLVMLGEGTEFAILLRYGLQHFQESLDCGRHDLRLDGFKAHAVWFAQANTPMEVLGLLWQSCNATYRVEMIQVMRQVINSLPPWNTENDPGADLPRDLAVASSVIAFVREERALELVPALRSKSLTPCWWMKSKQLANDLLLTMFALDYSLEVNEFLGQVIDRPELLEAMSYERFSSFCLAYIAGLAQLDATLDASKNRKAAERLRVVKQAVNRCEGRPEQVLSDRDGGMQEKKIEFDEALHLLTSLSPKTQQLVKDIADGVIIVSTEKLTEESRKIVGDLFERFAVLDQGSVP